MVWNLDVRYPKGYRSSYNTSSKMQIQNPTAKESHTKKSKPKEVKQIDDKAPALFRSNKSAKPNC